MACSDGAVQVSNPVRELAGDGDGTLLPSTTATARPPAR